MQRVCEDIFFTISWWSVVVFKQSPDISTSNKHIKKERMHRIAQSCVCKTCTGTIVTPSPVQKDLETNHDIMCLWTRGELLVSLCLTNKQKYQVSTMFLGFFQAQHREGLLMCHWSLFAVHEPLWSMWLQPKGELPHRPPSAPGRRHQHRWLRFQRRAEQASPHELKGTRVPAEVCASTEPAGETIERPEWKFSRQLTKLHSCHYQYFGEVKNLLASIRRGHVMASNFHRDIGKYPSRREKGKWWRESGASFPGFCHWGALKGQSSEFPTELISLHLLACLD